jgi:hypothetical protein
MKNQIKIMLSALALVGFQAQAQLETTVYGGHTYELWGGNLSWSAAEAAAVSDGGYLAVLTTSGETTAVYSALIVPSILSAGGEGNQAWLGGQTADGSGSTTSPNNWVWVTGETWTAFDAGNFAGGEPNGDSEGLAINRFGTSQWNDEGGFVGGYIVEINGAPDSGSTLALMATALTGLCGFVRRFRK